MLNSETPLRCLKPPQPQRIRQHKHAGEGHGGGGPDGGDELPGEGVEDAGSDRDESRVVGEGPEEVLANVAHHSFREGEGVGDTLQVAGHEHHVRRFDSHVRARADGHAHVGLREGRGVVDAVADEGHRLAVVLK